MIDKEIVKVKNDFQTGKYFAFAIGALVLGFTIYAMSLSVKVNKLTLKKFKEEEKEKRNGTA